MVSGGVRDYSRRLLLGSSTGDGGVGTGNCSGR